MPDTLQKLHQSSQALEQNQTTMSQRIYSIQQRMETIEKEVNIDISYWVIGYISAVLIASY